MPTPSPRKTIELDRHQSEMLLWINEQSLRSDERQKNLAEFSNSFCAYILKENKADGAYSLNGSQLIPKEEVPDGTHQD